MAPAPVAARTNGFGSLPPSPPPPPSAPPLDVSFGAPDDALIAGARPRGIAPDTIVSNAPSPPPASKFNAKTIAIGVLAVVIVAAGVYSVIPRGGHKQEQPTVLAPRSPAAGIPTSLSDVVRIAAESARHTALETVNELAGSAGVPLTTAQLAQEQPNYQWIAGDQPSTTNTVVSITSGAGVDVIAVSGTDKDICAFGRWSPATGNEYVTMAHVKNCAATNTPIAGWSREPGGSAQDLPGVDGS